MNNYEPKSKEQLEEFFESLRAKSIAEIITLFGPPARELGPCKRERIHWDGKMEIVEYSRILGFLGTGSTAHILWVYECSNGQPEFFYTVDLEADPRLKEDHSKHAA